MTSSTSVLVQTVVYINRIVCHFQTEGQGFFIFYYIYLPGEHPPGIAIAPVPEAIRGALPSVIYAGLACFQVYRPVVIRKGAKGI